MALAQAETTEINNPALYENEGVCVFLHEREDPALLQGIGDDAAVIEFRHPTLVASCDAFRAMIDDPIGSAVSRPTMRLTTFTP